MSDQFLPVILAGGAGTRLWPLSRELYPKQFLRLVGEQTMLQLALDRLRPLPAAPPILVCNHDHRFVVAEQCRQIGALPAAILLEPEARNTAPALALAALYAAADGDDVLLVLPADSHITPVAAFHAALEVGLPLAREGAIVVFGTAPTAAETGFGYIHVGKARPEAPGVAEVAAFVEKPSRKMAEKFLAHGGYRWNSGMFLLRASVYLDELRAFRPEIHANCADAMAARRKDLDFIRPGEAFARSPAESIDYAVMENTRRALVVSTDMRFADIGSWRAVSDTQAKDADGNSVSGDVIAIGTTDSHLASSDRLVAAVGLRGAVVVETTDAVLVAAKERIQDVRQVAERLRALGRDEHRSHTTSYRPWGQAETFKKGDGFLVKRICVAPEESLSLQLHRHRAEHWVVVRGEAEVRCGERVFRLAANESTYIPAGVRHRLANPTRHPLEVIEVQVGEHLCEDDIVRFADRYGREG